jgi:hypothetical protein
MMFPVVQQKKKEEEVVLTDRELLFINTLIETGGSIKSAAEEAGYAPGYAYALRKRLSKFIAEAAQQYLAIHSVKAAKKVVDAMDEDIPNPVRLQAAQAVLDRAGVIKKDFTEKEQETGPVIRANIFILPEKRDLDEAVTIEHERS